jgi:hypothetical protein
MEKLDYAEVRENIKDGDIVLFRGKSLLSRIIYLFTRSPYSHAGIVAWWDQRLMVLEAVGAGVIASRLSIVVKKYDGNAELWTANADDIDRAEIVAAAKVMLGKRYSKWKLLGNLRVVLFGPRQGDETDPDIPPEEYVCSEYVSRAWRAGGVDLKKGASDRFTKPVDIASSPAIRKVGDLQKSGDKLVSSEPTDSASSTPS